MFSLFRKPANDKSALEKQYGKLMEEAYQLSHKNRKQSDEKRSQAEAVLKQLESLEDN